MCGRYSLTTPVGALQVLFEFEELPNLAPRYNIAPTQEVAVVRAAPGEQGGGSKRHLVLLRWGLVPSWAKDPAAGAPLINARAETLAEKPAFRAAFRARRCLIPADGFYEWQARERGPKQPYRIALRDGGPFAFAGLWEAWRDPAGGRDLESCTIVTRVAEARISAIHPRMPVILPPEAFGPWLDPAAPLERLEGLLAAEPSLDLVAEPISTRINKVANDDPSVILPVEEGATAPPDEPDEQPRLL